MDEQGGFPSADDWRDERGLDDGWSDGDGDDDWDDWEATEVDARLRRELIELIPLNDEAVSSWSQLAPAMRAARRRRQAARGLAATVALAVLAVGGLQLAQRFGSGDGDMLMTAPADGSGVDGPATTPTIETGVASSIEVVPVDQGDPGTGEAVADGASSRSGTTTTAVVDPPPTSADTGVVTATIVADTATAGTGVVTTAPPPGSGPLSSATTGPSTTNRLTTAGAPSTTELGSDLGSIVVSVLGTRVELVESRPGSGAEAEVHNPGPEKVEVSFKRGATTIEISAFVRNGRLVTDIEDESAGTGDDEAEHR